MKAEERRQYKSFAETIRETDAALYAISTAEPALISEIQKAYDELRSVLSLEQLKSVDVEVLNTDKEGIRVAAFRSAGVKTVADVVKASTRALESIPGVGPVMAAKAKRNADALRISKGHGIRVQIDADVRRPAQNKLVHAVGKLLRAGKAIKGADKLYQGSHDGIMVRLQVSDIIGNPITWLFNSNEKKQRALLAYGELHEYAYSAYYAEAREHIEEYRKAQGLTAEELWQDFCKNAAPYYALMFSVVDGNTEAQTEYGGIPEKLVGLVNAISLKKEHLKAELRRYQDFGTKYIIHGRRVLLGDEMGLGKTIEAIAAMAHIQAEGGTHFLVVCPLSVLVNWKREVASFSDIPVDEIYGFDRAEELTRWVEQGGTAITTYETAQKLDILDGIVIDMLVVDEAQYIKNPGAQRSKAVRRLCERAERVLMMSGTPLENHVDEMIHIIDCLQPELVPELKRNTGLANAERFRQAIAPVYLRRTREQVLKELPDKEEIQEWCVMSDVEKEAYCETLQTGNFMEIRQLSFNVSSISESTKARRLLEIVDAAEAEGRKVLVFSFFRNTLRLVSEMLGERSAGVIDGSKSLEKRQELLDHFQKDNDKSVLVCQVIAGGVGLNVQAASVIIFCEPQLKPSMEEQAIGRAFRMGQSRKVMVYRLLMSDTVDERILEILSEKKETFNAFANDSVVAEADREISSAAMEAILAEEKKRYGLTEEANTADSSDEADDK